VLHHSEVYGIHLHTSSWHRLWYQPTRLPVTPSVHVMSSLCLAALVSLPVWVVFQCYIITELCLFGEYSVIHACNSAARINASVDSKCCWRYSFPCLTTPLTVNVRHISCVRSDAQTDTQTSIWVVTTFKFILPYRIRCGQYRALFATPLYCPPALS